MMIENQTFYVNKVTEFEYCDSKMVFLEGGKYEKPFHVKPTDTDHNLSNCDNCKAHHETLLKEFTEKLEKFPDCCEAHSNLPRLKEFSKEHFKDSPIMVADAIMFSYHHFLHYLDQEDWYNEITSYIEYCISSFGSIPPEFGSPFELGNYFNFLLHLIKHQRGQLKSREVEVKELNIRFEKIVSYLEGYFENENQKDKNINLLMAKYNDWYKIFPFDLSYFMHLKNKFRMTIPLFKGKEKYNKYLGITTREYHTKESLTQVLIETTKNIISNINGLSLYEKAELSETEKIELELIIENRKIELSEIASIPNKTSKIYIKTLKKWFKEEKKFIQEITPLLKDKSPTMKDSELNRTDIAYYVYYMDETKSLNLNNPFPSDSAWKEIGELFQKNWKNIQQVYNIICSDREERLKPTRIRNIERIINKLLPNHDKALKLAKDELNVAKLNS